MPRSVLRFWKSKSAVFRRVSPPGSSNGRKGSYISNDSSPFGLEYSQLPAEPTEDLVSETTEEYDLEVEKLLFPVAAFLFDRSRLARLLHQILPLHPSLSRYFRTVKGATAAPTYGFFLMAIDDWWRDSIDIYMLVKTVSEALSSSALLLEGLEPLLRLKESCRLFVCLSDIAQEISFTILTTMNGVHVFPVSNKAKVAECGFQNTEDLRAMLHSTDTQQKLLEIPHIWIPPIMQLLQFELDGAGADNEYKKKCLRYLRKLAKIHHVLPPSLFLKQIVKESSHAVRGGGFADIWKGRHTDDDRDQLVCLKVLRLFLESDEQSREKLMTDFCHEALIWRQLHHPNVLTFLGVNIEIFSPGFCLISPWMSNGDIISYLKNHPNHDRLSALVEIASGMNYLHSFHPSIVHGDIRGANILVTDKGTCCLADFGLALAVETQAIATSTGGLRGSVRWLAPELIGPSKFPTVSDKRTRDIYAFACTTLEIISGRVPFAHRIMDAAVIFDIVSGNRPSRPEGVWCPDEVWTLVEKCWAQDPAKRLTSKAICKDLALYQDGLTIPPVISLEPSDSDLDDQSTSNTLCLLFSENTVLRPTDHIMFVDTIPRDATLQELWKLFTDVVEPRPSSLCADFGQRCAFVKYTTNVALSGAITLFNGSLSRPSDPSCDRMQCYRLSEKGVLSYACYSAQNKVLVMTADGLQAKDFFSITTTVGSRCYGVYF